MTQGPSWKFHKLISPHLVKNSPNDVTPESSLSYSQNYTICSCPESHESSPNDRILII